MSELYMQLVDNGICVFGRGDELGHCDRVSLTLLCDMSA